MFQSVKQIILKVTRGCNLRCHYCYVFDKDKYNDESMSFEVFEHTLKRWFSETKYGNMDDPISFFEEAEGARWNPISLVFHGGEPLKIGIDKFAAFCKIATQLAREYGKMLDLSVQTNGTLIDNDWIDLFRRYKISPGISFDGFGQSDANRSASSRLIENMIKLRSYGFNTGIMMMLHKQNHKDVIENFKMLQSMGYDGVKVNRAVDIEDKGDFELTADELLVAAEKMMYFMFYNGGFREAVLKDKMNRYVKNISFGQEMSIGDICYTRYCGAGNGILEIEPDGSALFCGRNSKKSGLVTSGDVYSKDVAELLHGHRMWQFHKSKSDEVIRRKCNLCPAQSICDYGCLSFSYQKFGKGIIDDVTCDYNKGLITLFNKNRLEISEITKGSIKDEHNFNYFM